MEFCQKAGLSPRRSLFSIFIHSGWSNIISINPQYIKGIKMGNIEYRLTQFADDTTLLMDGSRESLHAALNKLEIFGWIEDEYYENQGDMDWKEEI